METYDVSGLPRVAAMNYIKDIIVHLKTLEGSLKSKLSELELWNSRVPLAERSLREDLKTLALEQIARIQSEVTTIQAEIASVKLGLDVMKDQLNSAVFASAEVRDSADALLREMEDVVGAPDRVTPVLNTLGVDAALEELKKNLQ
ncbi:MAG: hypothetical protein A2Z96_04415 [Spirochaetes bacterium GWB1_48_6]|nr:MAG: hypothetical protein A2Z96_04415 [Spirochaetes bacterium GWB1_48_6]